MCGGREGVADKKWDVPQEMLENTLAGPAVPFVGCYPRQFFMQFVLTQTH